jgi:heat shock protein HslJ
MLRREKLSTMKKASGIFSLTLLLVAFLSACGKYEEGPGFSLLTKKQRLCRSWQVESVKYGSVTVSPDEDDDYYFSFDKDGTFSQTQGNTTYSGTWDFTDDKETVRVSYGGSSQELDIKRLTNDEFWFTEDSGGYYKTRAK